MSHASNGDTLTRNPTPTIITGLTTASEKFAGLIKSDIYREATVALIPIVVLLIVIGLRNWKKEFEFKRGIKYYNEMIAELQSEYSLTETSKPRKAEIALQIKKHRNTLDKLREDNIKIITN